jgi:hypothetical protein
VVDAAVANVYPILHAYILQDLSRWYSCADDSHFALFCGLLALHCTMKAALSQLTCCRKQGGRFHSVQHKRIDSVAEILRIAQHFSMSAHQQLATVKQSITAAKR